MDLHSEMILEEYREARPVFEKMQVEATRILREALERNGLIVTAIESRIKTEESLKGKLSLKGSKYATLSDITDILGARIITFYTDDVDRIASMAEQLFEIDWANSVANVNYTSWIVSAIIPCIIYAVCLAMTTVLNCNSAPRSNTHGRLSTTTTVINPFRMVGRIFLFIIAFRFILGLLTYFLGGMFYLPMM